MSISTTSENEKLAQARLERLEKEKKERRKKMKVLPHKMDAIAQNLIQECEVMNMGEENAIEYIEQVTNKRMSVPRYYALKKKIHVEDATWLWNFTARGGFIRFFRERMFVFTNLLQNLSRQYNLELSTRPHENQDFERLDKLGNQIIKVNTLLAQYGMSSPVLVAMKIANDPNYRSINDVVDEEEKQRLILEYRKQFTDADYSPKEIEEKIANKIKSKQDKLNKEIGFGIAERQSGIRYSRLYENSEEQNDTNRIAGGSGNGREISGETEDEGTGLSEGEREYRRQKDKAVF